MTAKILALSPELGAIQPDLEFGVFERSRRITNLNASQVAGLAPSEVGEIGAVLREHTGLLNTFSYRILERQDP